MYAARLLPRAPLAALLALGLTAASAFTPANALDVPEFYKGETIRFTTSNNPGGGFDIVVDATGAAAVSEQCVPLTRSGGTVMFYGVTEPEDLVKVSPYDVFRREITIKGSFAEINAFPAAIAALRSGRGRTDGLITHRFPLDDYASALDTLRGDRTVHKIIIECWQG